MLDIMEGKEEEILKRLRDVLPEAYEKLSPIALLKMEGEALYAVLSVGGEITAWANELLARGEYVKSLLEGSTLSGRDFLQDIRRFRLWRSGVLALRRLSCSRARTRRRCSGSILTSTDDAHLPSREVKQDGFDGLAIIAHDERRHEIALHAHMELML